MSQSFPRFFAAVACAAAVAVAAAEPAAVERALGEPALTSVPAHAAAEVTGLYQMSDGRVMKVVHRGGRLVATLGDGPEYHLFRVRTARLQFRTADDEVRLHFMSGGGTRAPDVVASLRAPAQRSAALAAQP